MSDWSDWRILGIRRVRGKVRSNAISGEISPRRLIQTLQISYSLSGTADGDLKKAFEYKKRSINIEYRTAWVRGNWMHDDFEH